MTWVIVQECEDCTGQGKLYAYNTIINKCYECEGTGQKEYYEKDYHYETIKEVEEDYKDSISIMLV